MSDSLKKKLGFFFLALILLALFVFAQEAVIGYSPTCSIGGTVDSGTRYCDGWSGCSPTSPVGAACTCWFSGDSCGCGCQSGYSLPCGGLCMSGRCNSCATTTISTSTTSTSTTVTTTTIAATCSESSTVVVKVDTSAPTGSSISSPAYSGTSTQITLTNGTDAHSGLASTQLGYETATLSNNACGSFSGATVLANNPSSPQTHGELSDGTCYRYNFTNTNGAGGTSVVSSTTKVDRTPPNSTISYPVSGTHLKGSITVSGTAQDLPLYSGLGNVTFWNGTHWTSVTGTTSWTRGIDTATIADGFYYLVSRAYDNSGNAQTAPNEGMLNLDFETGTAPSPPTYWLTPTGNWNLTTGDRIGGPSTKSINGSTTVGSSWICTDVNDYGTSVAGYTFNLTGYLKPVGMSSTAGIVVIFYNSTPTEIGRQGSQTVTGTSNWTFVYAAMTAPAGTTRVLVCVERPAGTGYVLADNLAITRSDRKNTVTVTFDNSAPSAGTVAVPAHNTSNWIIATITNGTDSVSGVSNTTLWVNETTYSSGACGASGTVSINATNPAGAYNHTGLTTGCYGYILTTTDRSGNSANSTQVYARIDRSAPSAATVPSCPSYDGDGNFSVTWGTGTDSDSGVSQNRLWVRNYTSLSGDSCGSAQSWESVSTTTGATAINFRTFGCYEYLIQTTNNAGGDANSTTCITKVDTSAPTQGTLGLSAYSSATAYSITITNGTDGNTSIANTTLERAEGTLSGDACSSYGAWSSLGTSLASPYSESGRTTAKCYKYRLNTTNAASLVNSSSEYEIKVDTTAPTGLSLTGDPGYTLGNRIRLYVNNGTDAETPITTVRLWYKSSALSAGACGAFGSTYSLTTVPFLNETSYILTGASNICYNMSLQSINAAGLETNFTMSSAVKVDNTPPKTSITSPTEGSTINSEYFSITGTASDAGSGISKVWVSYNGGASWAIATGTTAWTYTSPEGVVPKGSATIVALAEDGAGNNYTEQISGSGESFASGIPDDGLPDSITNWTSEYATSLYLAEDPSHGAYAIKYYSNSSSTNPYVYHGYPTFASSIANKTFYFSADLKATSAVSAPIRMICWNGTSNIDFSAALTAGLTTSYQRFSGTKTQGALCTDRPQVTIYSTTAANITVDNIILAQAVNVTGQGTSPTSSPSNVTFNGDGSNVSSSLPFPFNLTVSDLDGGVDLDCDGTITKCNVTCWSNSLSSEGAALNWDKLTTALRNYTLPSGNYLNLSASVQPYVYSKPGDWTCKAYFTDKASKVGTVNKTVNFSISPGEPITYGGCGFAGAPGATNVPGNCLGSTSYVNMTIASPIDQVLWIKASRANWTTLPEPGSTFGIGNMTFGISACPHQLKVNGTWQKLSETPTTRGTYPNPNNFTMHLCLSLPDGIPAGTYYTNFTVMARLPTDPAPE